MFSFKKYMEDAISCLRSFETWPNGSRDSGEPRAVSATKKKSHKNIYAASAVVPIPTRLSVGRLGNLWLSSTLDDFGWFLGEVILFQKKTRKNQHTGNSFPDLGGAQQLRSGSNIILADGWGFLSRFVEINRIGCFTQIQVDCLEISVNHIFSYRQTLDFEDVSSNK